jgi:hypothetical protein
MSEASRLTGRTELPTVGRLHAHEDPPQRLSLAHRLDRTARSWAAHCERTPVDRYDELLAQLEAMYPDKADPTEMVTVARAALPHLADLPAAALGQDVSLAPQTRSGIIYRAGPGGRFLLLPIVALLNSAAATRDLNLLAEVEQAVNRVPELMPWADACATVRDRTGAVAKVDSAIRTSPGIEQSDLAKILDLDKKLVQEILWVMDWARTVRRERDGRSYRLYLV